MTKSTIIFIVAAFVGFSLLNIAAYGVIGVFAGPIELACSYAVFSLRDHLRRPPSSATMRTLQRLSFHTRMPPAPAVRACAALGRPNGYRVKQIDETNGWILLSQPMSVFSSGLYYPVQITPSTHPGWYRVDVGVRAMGYQGLLRSDLTPRLQQCADRVEQSLAMETPGNVATA